MMYFLVLPCYLILLGAIWYTMNFVSKPNGNLLLGVLLPYSEMHNSKIEKIQQQFKKQSKILLLSSIPFILLGVVFKDYGIISTIYCFIWIGAILLVMQLLLNHVFDQMYELKKENGWVVGDTHMITIDTEVTRLKEKFLYSKKHWWICAIIELISCIFWIPKEAGDTIGYWMIGSNLFIFVTLLMIYMVMPRVKQTVYSENSEINVALNHSFCYEMTRAMVWSAYVNAFSWVFGGFMLKPFSVITVILVVAISSSIVIAGILFYACHRYNSEKAYFQDIHQSDYQTDDDYYWRGGIYNNPNDPKLWVEKRNGIGITMNCAKTSAKIMNSLITLLVVGMMVWLIYLIPLDFPSLSLQMDDTTIHIEATMYNNKIEIADITEAKVVNELPKMYRNNGLSDNTYDFGKFRVKDYGQCKVYVNKKNTTYVIIYTDKNIFLLNSDDTDEISQLIQRLKDKNLIMQE